MRKVCIIQARMGSSRLPGKVLKLLGDKEVLWHVYNRVKSCDEIDQVIIATTVEPVDDAIVEYCKKQGWPVYRGSETNVLSRYYEAACQENADVIMRVTCDCPLIDAGILSEMLQKFNPSVMDYMSTNYPERSFPVGLDCELLTFSVLEEMHKKATTDYDREHVTPYIYRTHPEKFRIYGFANKRGNYADLRWTLDTPEDYAFLQGVYDRHYKSGKPVNISDIYDEDESEVAS